MPEETSIITAIRLATKNPNRANIFLDGKYAFSLDLAQLADAKLKIGQNLSLGKIEELRSASEFGKLYQRTLEWVLTRPHSIRETKDYLIRKKFRRQLTDSPQISDADIESVVTRLVEKHYLDDRKFATYYVENRFLKKGISSKKLRLELAKKGINKDIIEQALKSSSRSEAEEIRKIIAKKRAKYDNAKLIQYLIRQGFDFALSQSVLHEMDLQNSAQNPGSSL